jgi:serine protease inhibitor
MALAMAHAGARGRTREEIERALGVTAGELVDVRGALARELDRLGNAVSHARFQLRTANSLWHQVGLCRGRRAGRQAERSPQPPLSP